MCLCGTILSIVMVVNGRCRINTCQKIWGRGKLAISRSLHPIPDIHLPTDQVHVHNIVDSC